MQSASWYCKTKQTKEQSKEPNTLNKQWLQKNLSPVDTAAAESESIVQVGALTRRAFGCINQAVTSIEVNVISDWVQASVDCINRHTVQQNSNHGAQGHWISMELLNIQQEHCNKDDVSLNQLSVQ